MRTFRYVICDVFTDCRFQGNPLAVFTDARGLDDTTMQALAAELNFSESVFVLRPGAGGNAKLRIFTPKREVPFAGHPVLGTAIVLAAPMQMSSLRLETGSGIVEVRLQREGPRLSFATMAQPLPSIEPFLQPAALFSALGVAGSRLPVEIYDNGIRHVFVVLDSKDEVANLRPTLSQLVAIAEASSFNVCAGAGDSWKTRMFAPAFGVAEDPATGSAAGPLALHLARHGLIPFGQEIRIEQGAEIGRPSTLYARPLGTRDHLDGLEVGGSAIVVARGEFQLP